MGSNWLLCGGCKCHILYLIFMDELTKSVRAGLKMKWMNNDHNISLHKMTAFYNTTADKLKEIIRQYESELISTKFNIIET